MTTRKQIDRLIKPLLERNPELAVVATEHGAQVVLRPVEHVIRGLWIDASSVADDPYYYWRISYTFWHKLSMRSGFFSRFAPDDLSQKRWSHPLQKNAFIEIVESEVLPILNSVKTIDDFLTFDYPGTGSGKNFVQSPTDGMRFYAALGDFDRVMDAAEKLRAIGPSALYLTPETFVEMTEVLAPLCEAGDRAGVAALLHRWEDRFIEKNGLQALYEKTPFPVELRVDR